MKISHLKALIMKDGALFIKRKHFVFFVSVIMFATIISIISGYIDFKHRSNSYSNWRAVQSQTLANLDMAWSLRGPGYSQSVEPIPLSILSYGAEDLITSSFETREWTKQFIGNLEYNPFLSPFIPRFDISMLILIILPVLLIFLLSDFCRDELVNKTYLNCAMFGVSPFVFLLSKIIAAFLPVFLVLCFSIGSCFLVIASLPIPVESLGARYFLFCLVSGVYLLFWTAVLLTTQIVIKNSLRSTATGIAIWICIVFVIPSTHMNKTFKIESQGSVSVLLKEKNRIYHEKAAAYDYYDKNVDKIDVDPFGAYGDFFGVIEEEILNCDECRVPDISKTTTLDQGIQNSVLAKISPTFVSTLIFSDLSSTGLLDYINFRHNMINYFKYFKTVWRIPEVLDWIRSKTDKAPYEILKKLDQPHPRTKFELILSNTFPLISILLINCIIALGLYFAISILSLKNLGDQK